MDDLELEPARLPFPITRTLAEPVELRAEDGGEPMLRGRFTTFDDPYEVNSHIEGHFIERIAPGAFDRTVTESRKNIKVLFNHGQDPTMGDQILGDIKELRGDANYAVKPFDGIPPLLRSGLEAGAYGASHRFSVITDSWDQHPTRSDGNPDGIPERLITEARLYEFGPVTFPANPNATAGIRSTTDDYYTGTDTYESVLRSAQVARSPQGAAQVTYGSPQTDAGLPPSPEPDAQRDVEPPEPQETSVSDYESPEDKAARVAELKSSLRTIGETHTGVLPTAIQTQFDNETAELRNLQADLSAYEQRKAFLRTIADDPKHQDEPAIAVPTIRKTEDIYDVDRLRLHSRNTDEFRTAVHDNALRSIDSQRAAKDLNHLVDLVETNDEEGELGLRILSTGSPLYRRAFAKYLRRGNTDTMTAEERAAIAVVGTTTTGGYAVPYIFDPTMYHTGVWTAENPYRKACRTVEITTGNNWRTVTVGAITSAYATEALAAGENAPSFGQPTYTVQRAQAFATVSIETLEDRSDITSELTSVFAESKDTLEENEFSVGAGTTVHPLGMFTDTAYTNQDTATDNVTALLDLQVLEGALPLRYRANAAFFMNRSTLRQLMALDTTYRYFTGAGIQFPGNPQPNQAGSNGGGNTGLLCLGYPVWEVPSAVSTLTTDSAIIVVFADPKSYIIVDRIGMNVEVVPTMLNGATPSFPTGQRGIYVYWRNTAKPIAADAGRSLSVQ